nr:MAG TPA: hypothetical protein [Caudoviricetes sp.]
MSITHSELAHNTTIAYVLTAQPSLLFRKIAGMIPVFFISMQIYDW